MRPYAYTQDKLFIGGEWVAPIDGEQVPSINPATGSAWALAAFGGKRDIDRAVDAAREAMRGPWGRMPPAERMAELGTRENGRPLREAKLNPVAEAQWYRYGAGLTDKLDGRHPQHAEIFIVTTRPNADGSPSHTRETGINWHSNLSYTTRPAMGSLLHCLEIPEIGGDTMFTNMYRAYDSLSDGFKTLIEPLQAVHDYAWAVHDTEKGRIGATADAHKKVNPPLVQPVVRVLPETGRKVPYVSEGITTHIAGMTPAERRPILKTLFEASVRPECTYRHHWRMHDMILWDNRCAMHKALRDRMPGTYRHMHRTTVAVEPSGALCAGSA